MWLHIVILKLIDMLRYTIDGGEKDRVPPRDEITYLENSVELQKIRFQREIDITVEDRIGRVIAH